MKWHIPDSPLSVVVPEEFYYPQTWSIRTTNKEVKRTSASNVTKSQKKNVVVGGSSEQTSSSNVFSLNWVVSSERAYWKV